MSGEQGSSDRGIPGVTLSRQACKLSSVDGKVSVPVGFRVRRAGVEGWGNMICGYGDRGGGDDAGDLVRDVGKLYAKGEETCDEGDAALGLSAGVDAGLLSVSNETTSRRLCRNMRSVSV